MSELRRWTIWQPGESEDVPPSPGPMVMRIYAGPTLNPGEKLELVSREEARQQWQEELLSEKTLVQIAQAFCLDAPHRQPRPDPLPALWWEQVPQEIRQGYLRDAKLAVQAILHAGDAS